MPSGGRRPGAGRPRGSGKGKPAENTPTRLSHRETRAILRAFRKGEVPTPLEVILRRMEFHLRLADAEASKGAAGDQGLIERHLASAEESAARAAPYCHAKLVSREDDAGKAGADAVPLVDRLKAYLLDDDSVGGAVGTLAIEAETDDESMGDGGDPLRRDVA